MKSILVIDTPTTCAGCPCYDYIHGVCAITYKDCELRKQEKPSWCPLRPLPSKRHIPITKTFGTPFNVGKAKGWNDCLKEITGETE